MYFLELSQAPPALDIMIASIIPVAMLPARSPVRHLTPTRNPTVRGERMAQRAGRTISLMLALVEMAMQVSESASAVPSMSPGMVLNWRRTSTMMAPAALLTLSMVRAAKRKGSMAPRRAPARTVGSAGGGRGRRGVRVSSGGL